MPITSVRGLLSPTPTLQEPWQTGQPPLNAEARSTRRGLRVGVVVSFGGSFVCSAAPRIARHAARPATHAPIVPVPQFVLV